MIALKANYRKEPTRLQEGLNRNLPTYVIKSNTYIQIENVIREIFNMGAGASDEEQALQEVEEAIEEINSDVSGASIRSNLLRKIPTPGVFSTRLPNATV